MMWQESLSSWTGRVIVFKQINDLDPCIPWSLASSHSLMSRFRAARFL